MEKTLTLLDKILEGFLLATGAVLAYLLFKLMGVL